LNFNPKSNLKNKFALLSEFKEEFLKYSFIHYSLSTHSLYERSVRRFEKIVGDNPVRVLSILDIENFKRSRIEAGANTACQLKANTRCLLPRKESCWVGIKVRKLI
jgi:hypothetical protein